MLLISTGAQTLTSTRPVGILTITQDQPGLKKLKWEVNWFNAQGEAPELCKDLLAARRLYLLGTVRLEELGHGLCFRRVEESVRRPCRGVN